MENSLDFNIQLGEIQQQKTPAQQSQSVISAEADSLPQQSYMPKFLIGAAHPRFCLLHMSFKVIAIVLYIVLGIFLTDKTLIFIIVTILDVFDFWVVKNITGRLLVGLRWWSHIKSDGSEEWVFESMKGDQKANTVDSTIFWMVSYITPLVWLILGILQLITLNLNNFFICMIGMVLSGVNLFNYIKCQKNHRQLMSGFIYKKAKENISPAQMTKIAGMAAEQALKAQFQNKQ